MTRQVECYAGSTYPEKPRAVIWEGQRYVVKAILSQRREPSGVGFRVRCLPDQAAFDLFYRPETDTWAVRLIEFAPPAS